MMGARRSIRDVVADEGFYRSLFGDHPEIVESKRRMLERVLGLFRERFTGLIHEERLFFISVPNRVEVLGKHTDYQGGETIVLTGPKTIFAVCAASDDGVTELVNADPELGATMLRLPAGFKTGDTAGSTASTPSGSPAGASSAVAPELLAEGVGARYSYTVAKRLLNNLEGTGCPPLKNVKSVFLGDIPMGGGTSGSSSKVIADFLTFTAASGVFFDPTFRLLIQKNGMTAGLSLDQEGVDPFSLALSMYLAHYENGLDFGELKGDRGVGTFGGSEDHTAILLGEGGSMLFCRFCPTEVLEKLPVPDGLSFVVAYSGVKAEKTGDAMEKYNRLSGDARAAVEALNLAHGTRFPYLREFYKDLPPERRAGAAFGALRETPSIAGRAYQFFSEREIIGRWVKALGSNDNREIGELINRSHELSREYLGNIVPEIDALQRSANGLGAFGASGFGGGFGGCCYALVRTRDCVEFSRLWRSEYLRRFAQYKDSVSFDLYPACRGFYLEEVNGL